MYHPQAIYKQLTCLRFGVNINVCTFNFVLCQKYLVLPFVQYPLIEILVVELLEGKSLTKISLFLKLRVSSVHGII